MKILVLNSGSSSLKYQIIDTKTEKSICKGRIEEIGGTAPKFSHETTSISISKNDEIKNHDEAFEYIKDLVSSRFHGAIKSIDEISAIGHRIVHGGSYFKNPVFVTDDVIEKIKSLVKLAPLHNSANLFGIDVCKKLFKKSIPQVAVFDTAYYSTLPPEAYLYPIPYRYYKEYNIRKYGFHGTSHKYVSEVGAQMLGQDIKGLKIISCHLGNGSSITAIKNGKAVDTSMGLTPLGGIMMGTRCGSLDPSVVFSIAECESLSLKEVSEILHKHSGIKGISGVGSDVRDVSSSQETGNSRAALAQDMMIYQIIKFIGGYIASMGGCDLLIFTGGIGENQWIYRKKICESFSFMGAKLDESKNKSIALGKKGIISSSGSQIKVVVVPANEELAIAKATERLLISR